MVPKKHLARAGGMTQIGEAISHLATPVIAGTMFVSVGINMILLIDMITYFFALATLISVRFPQPEKTEEGQSVKGSFFKEAFFGWKYIRERPGLFGLLSVFAVMNFLISITFLLITPLVLDMSSPKTLG